ncbi:PQQ-dependent sugar dehydrogenase [Longimicrobium sp.]|uniref:PQQ-dependent sugar dehydrogenase n=1 Tax=Longimicrobium sp. TaxID=2029185 RepID=UPI002BCC2B1E|nr:PQQ-dependent sugar dehydrogenase [Longimicrobium sp.]HSU17858.1 PQQ-dependent sugar dehydrogenase [Longimicrobium sp.]
MTRSTTIVPLALAALLAACGDRPSVREADAKPAAPAPAASAQPSEPAASPDAAAQACDAGNGGLTLPAGFCATVFADVQGGPRHIAVAPNGDVFVAVGGGRNGGGGVMALRDTNRDGKADQRESFGSQGGTGVAVSGGWLYFAPNDGVVRWRLAPGRLAPTGEPQTIVTGLPTGGHTAKNVALDGRGGLFVNLGSRTNACQQADRQRGSRGIDPCTETEQRAGIWRFDANRPNQRQGDGQHWARGIRNGMGLAFAPGGQLYATQHGRDQLHDNWPDLFDDRKSAENPAEEFFAVNQGDDFGWPYCFYDVDQHKLVLAPEYGGRGTETGRCAQAKAPLVAFPGHWAPESLVFYTGTQFPARYRGGAFIAFHGSWNRAPLPQAGFRVSFVPMTGGHAGTPETFADTNAGNAAEPAHRPMGLAVAPDGALFLTDDAGGRIWRIVYRGR